MWPLHIIFYFHSIVRWSQKVRMQTGTLSIWSIGRDGYCQLVQIKLLSKLNWQSGCCCSVSSVISPSCQHRYPAFLGICSRRSQSTECVPERLCSLSSSRTCKSAVDSSRIVASTCCMLPCRSTHRTTIQRIVPPEPGAGGKPCSRRTVFWQV